MTSEMDETKRRVFNRLFTAVKEMRTAQRCYFADRTTANLTASKAAEREVDEQIRRIENRSAFVAQSNLDLQANAEGGAK